jgi:hypothetical protein
MAKEISFVRDLIGNHYNNNGTGVNATVLDVNGIIALCGLNQVCATYVTANTAPVSALHPLVRDNINPDSLYLTNLFNASFIASLGNIILDLFTTANTNIRMYDVNCSKVPDMSGFTTLEPLVREFACADNSNAPLCKTFYSISNDTIVMMGEVNATCVELAEGTTNS